MTLKVGMQHRVLEYYQVCWNDDPGLTLIYFTAKSNWVPYAFVLEKGKTMDLSETIAVYNIIVGICSQLNEYINLYECQRSRSLFDLGARLLDSIRPDMTEKLLTGTLSLNTTNQLDSTFLNFFSLETAMPIEEKFHV